MIAGAANTPTLTRTFGQAARYAAVGAWNTLFGYGVFALLNHAFRHVAYGYIPAVIFANLIAISVAFLGYKWFVFRTRGNYLREWLKTNAVYGTGMVFNAAALGPVVGLLHRYTNLRDRGPYVAQAFLAVLIVFLSFFGNKHFTFASRQEGREG